MQNGKILHFAQNKPIYIFEDTYNQFLTKWIMKQLLYKRSKLTNMAFLGKGYEQFTCTGKVLM